MDAQQREGSFSRRALAGLLTGVATLASLSQFMFQRRAIVHWPLRSHGLAIRGREGICSTMAASRAGSEKPLASPGQERRYDLPTDRAACAAPQSCPPATIVLAVAARVVTANTLCSFCSLLTKLRLLHKAS